jgi:hypothetical protein
VVVEFSECACSLLFGDHTYVLDIFFVLHDDQHQWHLILLGYYATITCILKSIRSISLLIEFVDHNMKLT